MAYEVDNLEIKIKSQADDTISSLDRLIGKIAELKGITTSAFNNLNNVNTTTNINTVVQGSQKVVNGVIKAQNETKKLANISTSTIARVTALYATLKGAYATVKNIAQESIDYTENLNLFTVSMGSYYDKAMSFQNQIHEAFGTNISDMLKYQGLFMQMATSMGVADKQAYMLSENFSKLGYDISSLYNISVEDANTKLKAGMAGQAEPLRSVGIDITEASLRPIAEGLGITESVRNMTQAEKVILRYIAVIRQAGNAQGDFARTIESPANQLKILKEQLAELGRAMANTFMGVFGAVLPYINAFVMALKEVFVWLGTFTGYTGTTGVSKVTSGVASDLDSANESSKKLKDNLQGFDELNLLQEDTSSNDSVSAGSGSVSPALLNAMSEYDNLMSSVQMKATGIRDKIMQWLGFTKNVNKETGEVTFTMENFDGSNLEKIRDILIGIGVAIGIIKTLEFISWIGNLGTALTNGSLISGLAKMAGLAMIVYGAFKLFESAKDFFNADSYNKEIKSISDMLTGLMIVAGGIFLVFGGIPALIALVVGVLGIGAMAIMKHWDSIKEFLGRFADSVGTIFKNVGVIVKNFFIIIGNGLIGIMNGALWAINKMVEFALLPFNAVIAGINSLAGTSFSQISFKFGYIPFIAPVQSYKNGGFPNGEDGLFYANHSELVGKFSNGKTAVANNGQIEAGIEEASYRGFMRALSTQGNSNKNSNGNSNVDFIVNGKSMAKATIQDYNEEAIRLGYKPILQRG